VTNDCHCLALSEATDGAGAGAEVVFAGILGTGVGAGIVVRGHLLNGPAAAVMGVCRRRARRAGAHAPRAKPAR
jgi:predicted NBD/HSP70 family sugar kinase